MAGLRLGYSFPDDLAKVFEFVHDCCTYKGGWECFPCVFILVCVFELVKGDRDVLAVFHGKVTILVLAVLFVRGNGVHDLAGDVVVVIGGVVIVNGVSVMLVAVVSETS